MLTIEQLKVLKVGDWVWIVDDVLNGEGVGRYVPIKSSGSSPHPFYNDSFDGYGRVWLAYKNKEEAEGNCGRCQYEAYYLKKLSKIEQSCEKCEERIRKETAREIYNAVSPLLIMKNKTYGNDSMTIAANEWFEKKVKEIFEPFGVEVK